MQTANSRSTLVPPTSKQSPTWSRGTSFSLDLSESKAPKVSDQKLSKSSSLAEKRSGITPNMQELTHLQKELKKAKEERGRALEELQELRSYKDGNLEKELLKAKESERTMLESLISQTKQFEQTKILLEEAKLEIRSLQKMNIKSSNKDLEKSQSDRKLPIFTSTSFEVFRPRDDIGMLQKELKLAEEAEEKSKKAMDDLALALKEVSKEANQVKSRLSTSQEESMQLKLETEDLIATLTEKEKGFQHYMKISEEEIEQSKQENSKLIDSLRVSREDNAKLRDILKHAVNEATVVKEALEIVRNENSQIQDLLSEKGIALQSIRQDYECLKVSERAAVDSVKELKGFLAATSNMDEYSIKSFVGGGLVSEDLEHIDKSKLNGVKLEGESRASEKQKKTMFKRFGDMLSRNSLHM